MKYKLYFSFLISFFCYIDKLLAFSGDLSSNEPIMLVDYPSNFSNENFFSSETFHPKEPIILYPTHLNYIEEKVNNNISQEVKATQKPNFIKSHYFYLPYFSLGDRIKNEMEIHPNSSIPNITFSYENN